MRSAVPASSCAAWLDLIDAGYRQVEIEPSSDFVLESSSFRLGAVAGVSVVDVWSALQQRCSGVV